MNDVRRFALFVFAAIAWTCRYNPSSPTPGSPLPPIVNAAYILNEGNFNDATGARLSIFDIDRDTVYNDVYELCNGGAHLGSTGDDIRLYNGRAYLVMSHSENLVALSLETHQQILSATFQGSTPHDLFIDSVRNRLYVSRTNSGAVYVLDPSTLSIVSSINVGNNPQGMALSGNRLFVCNSGYDLGRTVSVIDAGSDTVKATITVSDGPTNAAVAPDGKVWVVCRGNAFGTPPTPGAIFIIDPATLQKQDSIEFSQNLQGIIAMDTNGYAYTVGVVGFFGGPVHRISLYSRTVQMNFIPDTAYAMAIDEASGDIYVADARSFAGNGVVSIYSSAGVLRRTFSAGRGPGAIAFRHR